MHMVACLVPGLVLAHATQVTEWMELKKNVSLIIWD